MAALPALEVVWHNGAWRCLSNRRLWCLKSFVGLSGSATLHAKVQVLPSTPHNFDERNTSQNDGHAVQIIGHGESLRDRFNRSGRDCRHFFSNKGCARGDSCAFSHSLQSESGTAQEEEIVELKILMAQKGKEQAHALSELQASKQRIHQLETELVRLQESVSCSSGLAACIRDLAARSAQNDRSTTGTVSELAPPPRHLPLKGQPGVLLQLKDVDAKMAMTPEQKLDCAKSDYRKASTSRLHAVEIPSSLGDCQINTTHVIESAEPTTLLDPMDGMD